MAISPDLIARLQSTLRVGRSRVYALISKKANETFLTRELAAIALAADFGISVQRYASVEQLNEIRALVSGANLSRNVAAIDESRRPSSSARQSGARSRKAPPKKRKRGGKTVFVVHGRNEKLRKSMFAFLRSIGLNPLEWSKAVKATGEAAPYVGTVLDKAFEKAQAVVVLLTPDDEAKLREEFLRKSDPPYEKVLTGQARPNVLFEAGMAFGHHSDSTILVQVGDLRPFSDIGGRHVIHLNNSSARRQDVADRLTTAGCNVDLSGRDWHDEGDFQA